MLTLSICLPFPLLISAKDSSYNKPMSTTKQSSKKINLTLNGYQLSIRISGSGFPLILIHTWHPYAKHLLDSLSLKKYQIITFDTPGYYYKTSGKLITSLPELNHLLNKLFDHLKFEKVDLLGQCLGSVIALNFAAQYPNRVRNLIAVTPPLLCYKPKVNKALRTIFTLFEKNKIAQFLATHLIVKRSVLREISKLFGGYKGLTEVFAQESSLVSQTDFNPPVFFSLLSSAFHLDFPGLVKKVKARALFVSGAKDPLAKKKDLEELVKTMENASYKLVPSAKHALVIKNTKALTQLLLPFLSPKS